MNERMLSYLLKETEQGVRIMDRDKTVLHVFDYGKNPADGQEFVFVMAILPKDHVEKTLGPMLRPSAPIV